MNRYQSLRILVVGLNFAPEQTGIAPYTASFANGLVELGHRVVVKTTHPHYPEWRIRAGYGRWSQNETINGVKVQRLRHYVPRHPSNFRRVLSEITFGVRAAFSRWDKPDVVVLVSPALFSSAIVSLRLRMFARRTPFVVWVQDLYGLGITETGAGGGKSAGLISRVESIVLRGASGVAVIHERFSAHIARRLLVQENRIKVIRNWTHLEEINLPPRTQTRQRFGWNDDATIALHAGNIGAKQGLENLVEAARLAEEQGEEVIFVLLGNGNQRERIEASAQGLKNIQFIDPLPDGEYQAVMAAADVLIVNERPGVAEMAVPSKLTSYFSTGLPVVAATDGGSVTASEIASSGGGLCVEAGQPGALLEIVAELGRNKGLAAELGSSGLTFRNTVLSERLAIDAYAGWLKEIATN